MSYTGFNFGGANAVAQRPEDKPPVIEGATWAKDRVGPLPGTEVDATFVNRLKANLENLVTRCGGSLAAGDNQLADAVGDALDSKSDIGHQHDDRYYTQSEIDVALGDVDTQIDALQNQINGLGDGIVVDDLAAAAALEGLDQGDVIHVVDNGSTKWERWEVLAAGDGTWAGCTKVRIFTEDQAPASHGHNASDILDSTAASRSILTAANMSTIRTLLGLGISDISNLQVALDAKIPAANLVDNLTTNDATKPLTAAQGKALKDLYDALAGPAAVWAGMPIGQPIPIWTDLFSSFAAALPPTDNPAFRYVLLTAGEDGVGEYNEGILLSESVSGSAPTVSATAVVDLDGSPLDGETIHLINSEGRFLRPGTVSGTLQDSQLGSHNHIEGMASWSSSGGEGSYGRNSSAVQWTRRSTNSNTELGNNLLTSTTGGDETRSRNISATYIMRIK